MFKSLMSIIGVFILFVAAGCTQASSCEEEPFVQEIAIDLNFGIASRTGTETAPPENYHLWVFSQDGTLLSYLSGSDASSTNLAWQRSAGGVDWKSSREFKVFTHNRLDMLKFYLLLNVENIETPESLTPGLLQKLSFTIPDGSAPYNHDNSIPMSGYSTLETFSSQLHYYLEIDAVRSVSMLKVFCTKRDADKAVQVTGMSLKRVPSFGFYFADSEPAADEATIDLLDDTTAPVDITTTITGNILVGELDNADFTPMPLKSSYIYENKYGDNSLYDAETPGLTVPGMDNRYLLTLTYDYGDAKDVSRRIYLPMVERNTINRIYIRMQGADLEGNYMLLKWDSYEMDVPVFE